MANRSLSLFVICIASVLLLVGQVAASQSAHSSQSAANAQQANRITSLTVVKKPGETDGRAMATVKGKTGSIAAHAVQAWTIMDGQGALFLMSPQKKGEQYRLRFYELDAGKGRFLGHVPFVEATMTESKGDEPWAFAVSGVDPATKHKIVFAGDTEAIHFRMDGASEPHFSGDSLSFALPGGAKTIKTATLLGREVVGQIYAPSSGDSQGMYLQFLPNGDSIATTPSGAVERGRWITDGSEFRITSSTETVTAWRLGDLKPVSGIPATSRLSVRLLQPLSSRTARDDMEVKAVLISPGFFGDGILLPQGSEFDGKIVDVHGVGWGIKHETAALTIHFGSVKLPDDRVLPIDARVFKIENSRETVTDKGKIQGIRSTGTIGHSAENQIASLAQIDPIAYIFTGSAGPAVLGFAEPEILYNAGTELLIEFNKPVITAQKYEPRVPHLDLSVEQKTQFDAMVRTLPFRTKTQGSNKVSDITNLIFIGKLESVRRAFEAAGWTTADELTSAATFQTMKTLTGNQTYTQAPMSMLVLGDDKPLFTLQKATNTFSSRHHLRVFGTDEAFDGQRVLTASSTQDIGIAFSSKQKTFIHVIDQYLDNERSKVTNDLEFTGCVESIDLVPRPWVPQDAYNSTGDRLRTDGDAAVLRINDCANPHATPATVAPRAGAFERSERNTALTIKDTLYRGNLIYTGISGGIKIHHYFATKDELGENTGAWRKNDASGTEYRLAGTSPSLLRRKEPWGANVSGSEQAKLDTESKARIAAHRWDPPHYEIALSLGYSRYRGQSDVLELTGVSVTSSVIDPNHPPYFIALGDAVGDGWAASVSLTLNTWNWISNEFAYSRQQTKFYLVNISNTQPDQPDFTPDGRVVGLATRQFEYNTLFNLRPRKSRWRPYIAAGPVFQLIALADAPLKKPNGIFRLGLSNIGLIKAAFDFGSTPPLNGGGIFQLGLQYGGGIKYRIHPHIMLRGDFRETWSRNPRIIRDSYKDYEPGGLDDTYTTTVTEQAPPAKYFQQRATVGVAFTF